MILLEITFDSLHQLLARVFTDMMNMCSGLSGVAKGVAGIGALFYIGYRV